MLLNTMQDSLSNPINRLRLCKCGCGNRFKPAKDSQRFITAEHRKAYWKSLQSTHHAKEFKQYLKARDKFARYLKYEKRIEAWLKANKK